MSPKTLGAVVLAMYAIAATSPAKGTHMIPPRSVVANPDSSATSRRGRKAITTAASKKTATIVPQTHR